MSENKNGLTKQLLKSNNIPANILTMDFPENYQNKLSKLEPNLNIIEYKISNTKKLKNIIEKNIYQNINTNDMTFYNCENNRENINNLESTFKKSEVTFSKDIIDINSYIKRNSNGSFCEMSPVRLHTEKFKSVKQHVKTPFSKLRYEDIDSEDEGTDENKLYDNDKEIKICDEILSVKKIFFDKVKNKNEQKVIKANFENTVSYNENLDKNINIIIEKENNPLIELVVGNVNHLEKSSKINLNKKIELLNFNNNKLNSLTNLKKFEDIINEDENNQNIKYKIKDNYKIKLDNNSVKNINFLSSDEEHEYNSKTKNKDLLQYISLKTELKDKIPNLFQIANATLVKDNSKNFEEKDIPTEFLSETTNELQFIRNNDNDVNKEFIINKIENSIDKIDVVNNKFTPKSILKNSNCIKIDRLNSNSLTKNE